MLPVRYWLYAYGRTAQATVSPRGLLAPLPLEVAGHSLGGWRFPSRVPRGRGPCPSSPECPGWSVEDGGKGMLRKSLRFRWCYWRAGSEANRIGRSKHREGATESMTAPAMGTRHPREFRKRAIMGHGARTTAQLTHHLQNVVSQCGHLPFTIHFPQTPWRDSAHPNPTGPTMRWSPPRWCGGGFSPGGPIAFPS